MCESNFQNFSSSAVLPQYMLSWVDYTGFLILLLAIIQWISAPLDIQLGIKSMFAHTYYVNPKANHKKACGVVVVQWFAILSNVS